MLKIWIIAERAGDTIDPSYYEMLGKIREVYDQAQLTGAQECSYTAVCLTGPDQEKHFQEILSDSGADEVLTVTDPLLEEYQPQAWKQAFVQAVLKYQPDVVLAPSSEEGSEVIPAAAVQLQTGVVAHVADLKADQDGKLHMYVPAFGGKLMADNTIPAARPLMTTIKPGVFKKQKLEPADHVTVLHFSPEGLTDGGITFLKREEKESPEVSLTQAATVVCAGLGSAQSGNLEKVRALAQKLHAAVGYTRPLSDLGYVPDESAMIGTSGRTIRPALYLGFGVSGAGQHVCGIKDSGVIINVNNDKEAQCFDISDYRVVSDCGLVLDALLEALDAG